MAPAPDDDAANAARDLTAKNVKNALPISDAERLP
jgi:hypothetical protein